MANPNENNTKNWLYRLKHLRIRRSASTDNVNEDAVFRSSYNGNIARCTRTRNGFRRSIIKMHTRMKNVFKQRENNTNRNSSTISVPTSSSNLPSRITLSSSTQPAENIYSAEPIRLAPSPNGTIHHNEESNGRFLGQMISVSDERDSSISNEPPVIPPRRNFPQLSATVQSGRVPKNEIANLSNYYWYWGPISRSQAEDRLKDSPDGAFLVRDSTSDRYIFTMSFRNIGKILHTRIDFSKSGYSLFDQVGYNSVAELVEDAMAKSKNNVYCYTKPRDEVLPNFPVRLTLPVSRYEKVPTLKYLSRFVIRQFVNMNDMEKLPLPVSLIGYLQEEGQYF